MARRRAAPVVEEEGEEQEQGQEQEELESGLVKLKFNEALSWRPGQTISAEQLIKRLDRLSKELGDMDQEKIDTDSLAKTAKELAAPRLLNHKDKGVRAFAASCLVEMLRLYAPNAPYTPSQLKDIFHVIVNFIVPALADPTHPYNDIHTYVVQSLTEVKSIVILNELNADGVETLLVNLFSNVFDGVSRSMSGSGERLAKDVVFMMQDLLICIIEEASSLPQKVVDVIMAQFMRAAAPGDKDRQNSKPLDEKQGTLLLKEEPAAYQIAKTLCENFPEKMSRFVGQYFADVIMDATTFAGAKSNGHKDGDESEDDEAMSGPTDADLKELRKAHILIREVWKAAPTVLQNIVPQVESELSAENVQWRQLAVETLGYMISGIGAAGPPPPPVLDPLAYPPLRLDDEDAYENDNLLTKPLSAISFSQTHAGAFHHFLNRKNDKAYQIRAAWTTCVGYIISTSAGGIGLSREEESALMHGLGEKLGDADDRVRLAAVKAIEVFRFRDVIMKLSAGGGVSKENSLLSTLADRCRDRKPAVRVAAMSLMAKLWAVGTGELLARHPAVSMALSGVPSRIFKGIYASDAELNVLIDRVTFEYLIPLAYPPTKKTTKNAHGSAQSANASASAFASAFDADAVRVERIMLLVRCLDAEAKKAFFAMHARRQPQLARVVKTYITQCEALNGGVSDAAETDQRTAVVEKSAKYMAQFLPDKEKAAVDLMRFAKVNDRRNYHLIKLVVNQETDFGTAHKALKEVNKRISASKDLGILETLNPMLYRAGCFSFNRSHLLTIMAYSKREKDDMGAVAHEILNELSQHNPDLFKSHVGQLCKDLIEQAPSATKDNDAGVVETLKACSSFCRKYPKEIPMDRQFTQTLINYALYGRPFKAAKYAVNILLSKKDDKSLVSATDLLQRTMKDWSYGSPKFLNKLTVVSQLELLAPKITEEYDNNIVDMMMDDILLKVRTPAQDDEVPTWVNDGQLDQECQAKLMALKTMVNRLRASESSVDADGMASVWKLLRTLVRDKGELSKTQRTPQHHKARLRLLAAHLMMKLCDQSRFDDLLDPISFNELALTTQDPVEEVRHQFLDQVQKYLSQKKLRARFYTIVFLSAFEPKTEYKLRVEAWVRSRLRLFEDSKQSVLEATMARLLSLVAHHPDFDTSLQGLVDHAKYIIFYLSLVAKQSNLGLIYKYAERVKQTEDAIEPGSEKHRVMSDLAQAVIRKWQEKKNWPFIACSEHVGIPKGLYTALKSHAQAQEIAEKQYIPDGLEHQVDELVRAVDRKKRKPVGDGHEADNQPPVKKPRPPPRTAHAKDAKAKDAKAKSSKKALVPSKPKKLPAKAKKKDAAPATATEPTAASRRSGRSRGSTSYIERDEAEDEEEMLEGVAEWTYEGDTESDDEEAEEGDGSEEEQHHDSDGGGGGEDDEDDEDDDDEMPDAEHEERSKTKTKKQAPPRQSRRPTRPKPAAKPAAKAASKSTPVAKSAKPAGPAAKPAANGVDDDDSELSDIDSVSGSDDPSAV